tara:strand:- start:10941 stop:11567 length:627 start_codon:yes stop_codon:yes gene_type:complete
MKEITPYKSVNNAIKSLDNGGRFYNLITKANDGNITTAELSKVAGIVSGKQKMVLFLEMSLLELSTDSRKEILKVLSKDLKSAINKYPTQFLSPSEAEEKGTLSQNAIVTGIPTYLESKSDFKGFIMIPIMTGKVTTFTMIPIIDQYDVYEVRDHNVSEPFLIAHSKSKTKLPKNRYTFGGVLKELNEKEDENASTKVFLETHYYVEG